MNGITAAVTSNMQHNTSMEVPGMLKMKTSKSMTSGMMMSTVTLVSRLYFFYLPSKPLETSPSPKSMKSRILMSIVTLVSRVCIFYFPGIVHLRHHHHLQEMLTHKPVLGES